MKLLKNKYTHRERSHHRGLLHTYEHGQLSLIEALRKDNPQWVMVPKSIPTYKTQDIDWILISHCR